MANSGIDEGEGCSDWVLVEAECADDVDGVDEFDDLFERDTASTLSDLVDDASVVQGNTLDLFQKQEREDNEQQIAKLKRKYLSSPDQAVQTLSPRLSAIRISPPKGSAKKRLFVLNDSGLEISQHEADTLSSENVVSDGRGREDIVKKVLTCSNRRNKLLGIFKSELGVSYSDLIRIYQSDKTCATDWVIFIYNIKEPIAEASKTTLQPYSHFMFHNFVPSNAGSMLLLLISFKNQKCRESLLKLLQTLLGVEERQVLADPPKLKSTAAALYWYKRSLSNAVYTSGPMPEWIIRQTALSHNLGGNQPFVLSTMVQWALDNKVTEECEIAYKYALLGDEDENAAAFLNSNSQAKHVKDCATMVRLYLRAQMRQMSMSAWIHKKCQESRDDGSWREIVKFLRLQNIDFISFITTMQKFLKGTPKKNCMVFIGPPNTGKSAFSMSLLRFLEGKVISYANHKSHFWLQPLTDSKIGLLDDATKPCWDFFDIYLRNVLDGNPVSIDCKHKAPIQMKCPPLLVTTNVDVAGEERWSYLHSRLCCFYFPTPFPLDSEGNPIFKFTDESWTSFFTRFWQLLELSDQEEEGSDGESQQTLRVTTRRATDPL